MRYRRVAWLGAVALLTAGPARAFDGWHLESATVIEGKASGWDYVAYDAGTRHVFIGHRKEGLQVFDPVAGKVVKVIDGTPADSSNGATLMPELDLGLSNNEDGTVTPFALSTLAARPPVKLADELDTSHYDPVTRRVVVNTAAGADGTELVVLQAPSLEVVGKVKVPTRKVEGGDADGKGGLLLAAQDTNKLLRVDTRTLEVAATWDTPGCGRPTGVAADQADGRVFVSCRGDDRTRPSLVVLDAATGRTLYAGEIGGGTDSVVYDAGLRRVFTANGVNANLSVFEQVDADTYRPLEALGTRAGVRTVAMDHDAKKIYAVAAEGSADYSKKILTAVSPYYANTFFPNTFTVLTYSR